MAVPSSPAALVSTRESPALAPEEVTKRSRGAFPTAVVEMIVEASPGVTSVWLVRLFGVEVTVVGNAVTLPNADLVIGAQCSGINSILALVALNALVAYALRGPWWGRVSLVGLAVPLAMGGNILRVAALLVVARAWGADAAFRFYHDYSGVGFFMLALLLLLPLARLLQCKSLRHEVL